VASDLCFETLQYARDWQRKCPTWKSSYLTRLVLKEWNISMRNLGLGFVLLALGGLCSSHACSAQERPRRAGRRNRVIAAVTWPVRAYYVETKETLRDMRQDQLLRTEAVALFGAAVFENATLEYLYRQNPSAAVASPAGLFVGHHPHGVQLWLVSGATNLALLDAAHFLSRTMNRHQERDDFMRYSSLVGIVGLSTSYTVAGIHNLNLKTSPVSLSSPSASFASH
jgi:hypothetical protein